MSDKQASDEPEEDLRGVFVVSHKHRVLFSQEVTIVMGDKAEAEKRMEARQAQDEADLQRGRLFRQMEEDKERLDWLESMAPLNDLRIECDGHFVEYQLWLEASCLGKGISLRDAIDTAMDTFR